MANVKTSDRKGAFVENVSVSNVVVRGMVRNVAGLSGDPRLPARNVTLRNIRVGRCEKASSAENIESLNVGL